MELARLGVSARFWGIGIGLSILMFLLALFASQGWLNGSIPLFLTMVALAPLVVGFLSRSWAAILAPLLGWTVFTLVWAILALNVSHDPNLVEVLSWLHADLWPVWPILASGFTVGKLTRTAVQMVLVPSVTNRR